RAASTQRSLKRPWSRLSWLLLLICVEVWQMRPVKLAQRAHKHGRNAATLSSSCRKSNALPDVRRDFGASSSCANELHRRRRYASSTPSRGGWTLVQSHRCVRSGHFWLTSARTLIMAASKKQPNILVIFGDDIGQSQISAYTMGLMGYRTPNIDRIAKEGMIFTDAYAQQSCTAGRASFILGQEPF